jgi:plastocyanin
MDGPRSVLRSVWAGAALIIALVAIALSVLTLAAPPTPARPLATPVPVTIDLSMLITGRGAIGGPALEHLFDPQMLVVRQGDTVRLRVINGTHFRHGIEIVGYDVRTGPLTGGPQSSELLTLTADKPGIFEYRCYLPHDPATATCAPDHDKMIGHLVVVEPGSR